MPLKNSPNSFGAVRKYDIHTGVDLMCPEGTPVYTIENGTVINRFVFTGKDVGTPWWNYTEGVLVESSIGNILYGEITTELKVGDKLIKGDLIGHVAKVLKVDKGLPMSMLHLELYSHSYSGTGVVWDLNQPQPKSLWNPTCLIDGTGLDYLTIVQ